MKLIFEYGISRNEIIVNVHAAIYGGVQNENQTVFSSTFWPLQLSHNNTRPEGQGKVLPMGRALAPSYSMTSWCIKIIFRSDDYSSNQQIHQWGMDNSLNEGEWEHLHTIITSLVGTGSVRPFHNTPINLPTSKIFRPKFTAKGVATIYRWNACCWLPDRIVLLNCSWVCFRGQRIQWW